jgi:hypothetical protein
MKEIGRVPSILDLSTDTGALFETFTYDQSIPDLPSSHQDDKI